MSRAVADKLREAKAKIATPETWCQGTLARDAEGFGVGPVDRNARSWCAIGALDSVNAGQTARDAIYNAVLRRGARKVSAFNDGWTHSDVMAVFDAAIAAEEAET